MVLTYLFRVTDMPKPMTYFRLAAYPRCNFRPRPSASARQLLSDLGRRLTDISGESRETSYQFQRFSVPVQRFNAVLLHDSLPDRDCTDYYRHT